MRCSTRRVLFILTVALSKVNYDTVNQLSNHVLVNVATLDKFEECYVFISSIQAIPFPGESTLTGIFGVFLVGNYALFWDRFDIWDGLVDTLLWGTFWSESESELESKPWILGRKLLSLELLQLSEYLLAECYHSLCFLFDLLVRLFCSCRYRHSLLYRPSIRKHLVEIERDLLVDPQQLILQRDLLVFNEKFLPVLLKVLNAIPYCIQVLESILPTHSSVLFQPYTVLKQRLTTLMAFLSYKVMLCSFMIMS